MRVDYVSYSKTIKVNKRTEHFVVNAQPYISASYECDV